MDKNNFKFATLSGNTLKILAAVFMACDHIGYVLFPSIAVLRILGRLALPIFAFMIAEGCKYTRNKLRYFLMIFGLGVIFQIVFYIVEKSFYLGILITFSTSILMIYALMFFKSQLCKGTTLTKILSCFLFVGSVVCVYFLNELVTIDYGFWGCMLAVFASLFHHDGRSEHNGETLKKLDKIPVSVSALAIGVLILSFVRGTLQYYSLLALPLLLLYSGERGKYNMKYFFYIFYPLHLVVIYGIAMLI